MTANDSKSYISCLNKLVDEYNNSYHLFIGKKPINCDYSDLSIFLVKTTLKICQEKYL